jgi:hypothetical protein
MRWIDRNLMQIVKMMANPHRVLAKKLTGEKGCKDDKA